MNFPHCVYRSLPEESPVQCYDSVERFLKLFHQHHRENDSDHAPQTIHQDNDEHLSIFEHDMIKPINSLVQSMWDDLPSSLIAQHCESRPGKSTPFTDEESGLTEFVHQLPDLHHFEKSEHDTPRPRIIKKRRDQLEPASSDMYRMLKSVMNEFMVDFIGRHRVRIFLSFVLAIGHLFKCIYAKSAGDVEVELVLKGGVSVRLWMLMLFDSMPAMARRFAHHYVEKHNCVMFSDQDYDIIPVRASREQLRKVERLSFLILIRLCAYWHRHRSYYFEFYEMSEARRNQQLEKLLHRLQPTSHELVEGKRSIFQDTIFRHVVYEDENGQTRVVPPLPSTDCLVRDGQYCWAGYKGTSRNSFVRICNLQNSWDPNADDDWFLVDAQEFFHHEMDQIQSDKGIINHMQRCGYYKFQDRHHDMSFIYASYNTTCNTPTALFALMRIMANFSFLCEQNVRFTWNELTKAQQMQYLQSKNMTDPAHSALAYLSYTPTLHTYKIAVRIPGEIIDLANGHAFPVSSLNPFKRETIPATVFLNKVPVRITDIPTLAEEQIRMVFKELNWTPWLYGGKTHKRTCRMMLLVTWTAILPVTSWNEFHTAFGPLKKIRVVLNELAHNPGHRAYSARTSSVRRLLGDKDYKFDNSTVQKFYHEFSHGLDEYERDAYVDSKKIKWAKNTLNFLDFALFIFFVFVAKRLGFNQANRRRSMNLPDKLSVHQFDNITMNETEDAQPYYAANAASLFDADPSRHSIKGDYDLLDDDSLSMSSRTSSEGMIVPASSSFLASRPPPMPTRVPPTS